MNDPTNQTRVCVCGTEIPAYPEFRNGTDFEPTCRHCERTKMAYMDRELTDGGGEWIGERRCRNCGWTEPDTDEDGDAYCPSCGDGYPLGTDERTRKVND